MSADKSVVQRLSIMMFLQFFVWGAWYTTIAVYMTAEGMGTLTHWPYTVNPIAAIVAPFFLGFVADRYFATEKVLGVLHLAGGAVLLVVPSLSGDPFWFITMLLVYNLCYMPTLGLSNSLAFHHIDNQERQFPVIRVFGTLGWIVAGLALSFGLSRIMGTQVEATSMPLQMAGAASILLGLYSFSLPHTPPKGRPGKVSLAETTGISAWKELGSVSFAVFVISSFLISIPLAAYYNFTQLYLVGTGFENVAAVQTLGQVSEVFFMLLIPFFFRKLGVKWMLSIGMLAWVVRYALFALGAPDSVMWMIVLGIAMHGICYDFFFVTGQIYVDKKSTPGIRGQAQGLLVLITYGVGMLIGAQVAGIAFNMTLGTQEALTLAQWASFWWLPAGFAAAVLLFFVAAFRERA